jgi:ferric-dicitrate binding protein FerR (iron transport regulator)
MNEHDSKNPQQHEQDEDMHTLLGGVEPLPEPRPEAMAKAYATLKADWQAQTQARVRRRRQRVWLSAVASVAVVAVAVMTLTVQQPTGFGVALASGAVTIDGERFATPQNLALAEELDMVVDEVTRFKLDNGTDLRLAEGTRIRWYAPDRVFMQAGQIYVNTHDQAEFSVHTTLGRVRDIGTRYMVSLQTQALEVAVREGAAQVSSKHGIVLASADQQSSVSAVVHIDRSGAKQSREPSSAARWDWIHEASAGYESRVLPEVLSQIGRDLGKPVIYASRGVQATIAAEQVQGDLTNLAPYQALELVTKSAGLSWRELDQSIQITLVR